MQKIILPLLLTIFLLAGCGGDHVEKKNKYVIGLDDKYPPFGFRDDHGRLIGFDIDLADEVASRMGVEFEFKGIDWNNKYEELDAGNIDIIWSGFNITPEREEHVIFSKPYMDNRQIILVAKGKGAGIVSEADLAGKIVGTQLASPADGFINQNAALRKSFAKFIAYDNYEHVFQALAAGEIEAVVCDELVIRYEMKRHHDKFDVVEAMVGSVTEIAVGFRKSDIALRDRFQEAFDKVLADDTARKISLKWFDADLIKSQR